MRLLRTFALLLAACALLSPAHGQTPASRAASDSAALLRPGDVLRIKVWPDQSLSGEFPIETTGSAYLPVIGEVQAVGVPLETIRARLRARYAAMMTNPVVTITPVFRVSVLGAVQRPGLYAVDATQTVIDVISQAGGFSTTAQPGAIRLIRGGRAILLNGTDALESGDPTLSAALQSGDRIVVPERRAGRGGMQTALSILQTVAVVITIALQLRD
jgi:polysaccharide export outer membrane protein